MVQKITSKRCQVCRLDERWRLELLRAGGAGLDALAEKFGVSRDSIHRHWRDHVSDEAKAGYLIGPAELATLAEKAAIEGDSVLDYLKLCRTVLTGQLAAMTEATLAKAGLSARIETLPLMLIVERANSPISPVTRAIASSVRVSCPAT